MKALKYTATFAPKKGMKLSEKEVKDKRAYKDSDKVFKDPKIEGPVFMRLGRQLVLDIYDDSYRFVFGLKRI